MGGGSWREVGLCWVEGHIHRGRGWEEGQGIFGKGDFWEREIGKGLTIGNVNEEDTQ